MFSGSIAAILPELDLWIVLAVLPERVIAAKLPETNLHAKSSIAAILQQYCQKLICMRNPLLLQYCGKTARN